MAEFKSELTKILSGARSKQTDGKDGCNTIAQAESTEGAMLNQNGQSRWITVVSKQSSKEKPQILLYAPVSTGNYFSPLTSQINTLVKQVTFSLPHNHVNKNRGKWRQQQTSSKKSLQLGVLNGSIPSAISNTGATASAFKSSNP